MSNFSQLQKDFIHDEIKLHKLLEDCRHTIESSEQKIKHYTREIDKENRAIESTKKKQFMYETNLNILNNRYIEAFSYAMGVHNNDFRMMTETYPTLDKVSIIKDYESIIVQTGLSVFIEYQITHIRKFKELTKLILPLTLCCKTLFRTASKYSRTKERIGIVGMLPDSLLFKKYKKYHKVLINNNPLDRGVKRSLQSYIRRFENVQKLISKIHSDCLDVDCFCASDLFQDVPKCVKVLKLMNEEKPWEYNAEEDVNDGHQGPRNNNDGNVIICYNQNQILLPEAQAIEQNNDNQQPSLDDLIRQREAQMMIYFAAKDD